MHRVPHILHADVDAFFASVEQRDDPALRGRPVIVGGGVVMAASYEARAYGIRGGMGGGEARRRCPHAIVVSSNFGAYAEASRAVFDVLRAAAPAVEPLGLEEAFLDVREVDGAARARSPSGSATRCASASACRSPSASRARRSSPKMARRAAKPDGLLVVPAEDEAAFLYPMRVEELWGVGAATAAKLQSRGLTHGRPGGRAARRRRSWPSSATRPGGCSTPSPEPDRRVVSRGRCGGARSAPSARGGVVELDRGDRRRARRSGRARLPAHGALRPRRDARSCCACASGTSRARPARRRFRRRPPTRARSTARCASCCRA